MRTRSLLIDKAREVFEKKGYLDTVVADIAEAAGVAHGTFYKYFTGKPDVFRVLAVELQATMIGERGESPSNQGSSDGSGSRRSAAEWWERVEKNNRHYLTTYMQNAKLMAMVEQVATFDDEMLTLRRDIRKAFVRRSVQAVGRLQADGLAHNDIDPRYSANALGAMVDRFAYIWLVLGEDFELEEATRTLTVLWARALGVPEPA